MCQCYHVGKEYAAVLSCKGVGHQALSTVLSLTNVGRYWRCEIEKVMNASCLILSRQVSCTYLKARSPKGQCYHLYYFLSNEIFQICGKATSPDTNEIPVFAALLDVPSREGAAVALAILYFLIFL